MAGFWKAVGVLVGVGLLGNGLLGGSPKPSGAPATVAPAERAAAERTAPVAAQTATPTSLEATPAGQAAIAKVRTCLKQNDCAFHIVGIGTRTPELQLSVMKAVARKWSEAEFQAAEYVAAQEARQARAAPYEPVKRYAELPESAPFFRIAVANVGTRLSTYRVALVSQRKTQAPRSGVPGWLADEKTPQRGAGSL